VGTVLLIVSDDGKGSEKDSGATIVPVVAPETVAAAVRWSF
jgi:hypothetical protein